MRFYCPKPCEGHPIHPIFLFKFAPQESFNDVFRKKLPENFFEKKAEFTDIDYADAVVLPNNFVKYDENMAVYLKDQADKAVARKIPILAFSWGDLSDTVQFDPRIFVFRLSVYRSAMSPRDILMPTIVEDLGAEGIAIRKKDAKPTVSFVGFAGYKKTNEWLKYYLKVALYRLKGIIDPHAPARIVGIYWRRLMLKACSGSPLVEVHFIIRRSFSGAHKTIELDPAQARKEFIGSIVNSDYVLAAKGDGNFSNRFLEALSLGRIPVVPVTDSVLPLEGYIPYSKSIVLVPIREVSRTPDYIAQHYESMNEDEFELAQRKARELFEKYLRLDSYFEFFFSRVMPDLVKSKM